jgi:hypothetical protein
MFSAFVKYEQKRQYSAKNRKKTTFFVIGIGSNLLLSCKLIKTKATTFLTERRKTIQAVSQGADPTPLALSKHSEGR